MPSESALGLDLSRRAAAAVAVPLDWDGDFSRVNTLIVGEPLDESDEMERIRGIERIASKITVFARTNNAKVAVIESYAFHGAGLHTAGEVGGIVRLDLLRAGLLIAIANMSSSRKLLLGKLPARRKKGQDKKDADYVNPKTLVHLAWRAAGATWDSLDLSDAMTAVNLYLAGVGSHAFVQAPPA